MTRPDIRYNKWLQRQILELLGMHIDDRVMEVNMDPSELSIEVLEGFGKTTYTYLFINGVQEDQKGPAPSVKADWGNEADSPDLLKETREDRGEAEVYPIVNWNLMGWREKNLHKHVHTYDSLPGSVTCIKNEFGSLCNNGETYRLVANETEEQ
jgi:hypothetical protein